MLLSATPEEIKSYQMQLDKGEIKPDKLPACPRCHVDSAFLKTHAFRERKFLLIIELLVRTFSSVLVRFACPGCGKTFTYYPDFALPYKRYTRATVTHFSRSYVQDPEATYQKAVMVQGSVPGYPDGEQTLAPSTVHRFVTSVSTLISTGQRALDLIVQEKPLSTICRDIAQLTVPQRKYKSKARRHILVQCLRFFVIEALFQHTFNTSIFTKLAMRCRFG